MFIEHTYRWYDASSISPVEVSRDSKNIHIWVHAVIVLADKSLETRYLEGMYHCELRKYLIRSGMEYIQPPEEMSILFFALKDEMFPKNLVTIIKIDIPKWSDIPDRYMYRAQNKDGSWYAYETAPGLGIDNWVPEPYSPNMLLYKTMKENYDWRKTLERRPK